MAYKIQREKERGRTNPVPTKKNVVSTDWTTAHLGIKDSVVKDRKSAKQCTKCGFDRHKWAECYRSIQLSAMGS